MISEKHVMQINKKIQSKTIGWGSQLSSHINYVNVSLEHQNRQLTFPHNCTICVQFVVALRVM